MISARQQRAKRVRMLRRKTRVARDLCREHVPLFDEAGFSGLCEALEGEALTLAVRSMWPRFEGVCESCGYRGISYASFEHYVAGDW